MHMKNITCSRGGGFRGGVAHALLSGESPRQPGLLLGLRVRACLPRLLLPLLAAALPGQGALGERQALRRLVQHQARVPRQERRRQRGLHPRGKAQSLLRLSGLHVQSKTMRRSRCRTIRGRKADTAHSTGCGHFLTQVACHRPCARSDSEGPMRRPCAWRHEVRAHLDHVEGQSGGCGLLSCLAGARAQPAPAQVPAQLNALPGLRAQKESACWLHALLEEAPPPGVSNLRRPELTGCTALRYGIAFTRRPCTMAAGAGQARAQHPSLHCWRRGCPRRRLDPTARHSQVRCTWVCRHAPQSGQAHRVHGGRVVAGIAGRGWQARAPGLRCAWRAAPAA